MSPRRRAAREGVAASGGGESGRAGDRGGWGRTQCHLSVPPKCRALGTNPWGTGDVHFSRKLGHALPRSRPICGSLGDGDLVFLATFPHPHPCSRPAAPSQERRGPQLLREHRARDHPRPLQWAPRGQEDCRPDRPSNRCPHACPGHVWTERYVDCRRGSSSCRVDAGQGGGAHDGRQWGQAPGCPRGDTAPRPEQAGGRASTRPARSGGAAEARGEEERLSC